MSVHFPVITRIRTFCLKPTNLILAAIVAVSAFLRLYNIGNTPLWFVDEGTNMNMAWNLVNGKMQMFAITFAFVPHPPLSYLISGIVLQIFGFNITVARSLAAIYGILTTIVLFYLGKELLNIKVGLTASFLFSIFPLALVYNRMNLDYNLLQLLSIFTLFACVRYLKTRNQKWFYGSSVTAGVASITNPIGIGLIIGLFVIFFIDKNFKKPLKAVLIALGVFITYPLSMIALDFNVFTQTVEHYFFSHATLQVEGGYGLSFVSRALNVVSYSPWITFGLIGLLVYPMFFRKKNESIIITGLFLGLFLFTSEFFSSFETRGLIQLFPFFSLGVAFLIWAIPQTLINNVQVRLKKAVKNTRLNNVAVLCLWLCAFSFISVPLGLTVYNDFSSVFSEFHMADDVYRTQSSSDAYKVADYLNSHTNSNDFVIVSKQISWLINCNVTAIDQAAAFNQTDELGITRPSAVDGYTADRFIFNCSYQNAKFLVIDSMVLNWYYPQAFFKNTLYNVQTNWIQVYQLGEYSVFLNPMYNTDNHIIAR